MADDPLPSHSETQSWKSLGTGGPTIHALARLAGASWADTQPIGVDSPHELSAEARTILALARQHGVIELKSTNIAFDSTERLLTVHVQLTKNRQRSVHHSIPGWIPRTMRFRVSRTPALSRVLRYDSRFRLVGSNRS